ncbi:MAG: hypothetical protein KDB27_25685 [Planctomycetales bacterium]|nr:hypothetical protein [Planctomycetales bacterium]
MARRIQFSIRHLIVVTAVAAMLAFINRPPPPKPFYATSDLLSALSRQGWSVEVAPSIKGPLRTVGCRIQYNPGQPALAWYLNNGVRQTVNHPGQKDTDYQLQCVENPEGEVSHVILRRCVSEFARAD